MADVIGMSDVSSPDTGKGSQLKTGGKRKHNMASKCKTGQVWNQKLKKCTPAPNRQKAAKLKAETKQKNRKVAQKMKEIGPNVGDDSVRFDNF
tara:strand:+ start:297 stop:575 length:279 start_codon:yes stop_codon:yes gene_type:complete